MLNKLVPVYIIFKIASHTHFDLFLLITLCNVLYRLAVVPAPTIVQIMLAGLTDSQGVESDGITGAPQNAVRFRPATKRMVAPASSARCSVQATKNSCVGHLLVAVPRYYLTHQSRSPVFLLFLHFSLQILPSCNNWVPQ